MIKPDVIHFEPNLQQWRGRDVVESGVRPHMTAAMFASCRLDGPFLVITTHGGDEYWVTLAGVQLTYYKNTLEDSKPKADPKPVKVKK